MEGKVSWDDHPSGMKFPSGASYPHCDARILHLPEECHYCAEATWLQEERERLDVCNSGHGNRTYICPADRARGLDNYSRWHGNKAQP